MVNGVLYLANSDGSLSRMTFNGSTYGSVTPVNVADALVYQDQWHADVRTLTSLFYSGGYLYYTKSGTNALYRRGFEVESGIVGQQRFSTTTSGINYANVRGAFVAAGKLYFASTTGSLSSATWSQASHSAVAGTVAALASAGTGWSSRALFPYQGAPAAANQPPVANASVSCDQLACTFDGTGSTDPEGGALTYDWDFGDGTAHGSGAEVTHTYGSAGDRSVTLTVTDDKGATNVASRTASPTSQADAINFVARSNNNGNRTNHTIAVPAGTRVGDTLLLFFAANSTGPNYAVPAGWTQVLSDEAGEPGRTALVEDGHCGRPGRRRDGDQPQGRWQQLLGEVADPDPGVLPRDGHACRWAAAAITAQDVSAAVHQTPTVNAADGNSWLVSYWTDKSTEHHGLDASGRSGPALGGRRDRRQSHVLTADRQRTAGRLPAPQVRC